MSEIQNDDFIIIIGSMKCGTSSLYNYLIEHPSICPCSIKEPEYFSVFKSRVWANGTDLRMKKRV